MKDLIKEVALSVWASQESAADTRSGDQIITDFATAFLAELSKQCGPIYQICKSDSASLRSAWIDVDRQTYADAGLYPEYGRRMLFTFQPIHDIEAIENMVAEACAKACIKEAVQIVIDGPEERAYNNATSDCAEAIKSGAWREYK